MVWWGPNTIYIVLPIVVVSTFAFLLWWSEQPRWPRRRTRRKAIPDPSEASGRWSAFVADAFPEQADREGSDAPGRWSTFVAEAFPERASAPPPQAAAPPGPAPHGSASAAATRAALAQLPDSLPYQPRGNLAAVPLVFDGRHWHMVDLTRPEDMVIAGMKRHGKGNALQVLALEILYAGPDAASLVVLDMKLGVDYSFVRQVAHGLLFVKDTAGPDIPRDGSITDGLKRLKQEMDRRYGAMIAVGARNLDEYNARVAAPLQRLYIIADEVADFSPAQKADAEELARVAGGAGLVFFWATQRPEANVLSLQIQGNATRRLVFRLAHFRDHYVSLRIPENTQPTYDLTAITKPGVAALRIDGGQDHLGHVPTVTDAVRDVAAASLVARWPRMDAPPFLAPLPPDADPGEDFATQVARVLMELPEADWKINAVFRLLYPGKEPGGRRLQRLRDVWNQAVARVEDMEEEAA